MLPGDSKLVQSTRMGTGPLSGGQTPTHKEWHEPNGVWSDFGRVWAACGGGTLINLERSSGNAEYVVTKTGAVKTAAKGSSRAAPARPGPRGRRTKCIQGGAHHDRTPSPQADAMAHGQPAQTQQQRRTQWCPR